jgi:hypothetical protein
MDTLVLAPFEQALIHIAAVTFRMPSIAAVALRYLLCSDERALRRAAWQDACCLSSL